MQIFQRFVAATLDGRFLALYVSNRWGSEVPNWSIVASIEDATILVHPTLNCIYGHRNQPNDLPAHRFVPVEVRHEVLLQGYGVPATELPFPA